MIEDICRNLGLRPPSYELGRYYTPCPRCSAHRKPANRNLKCLGVTIGTEGVKFGCNHCGWRGGSYIQGPDRRARLPRQCSPGFVLGTSASTDEAGRSRRALAIWHQAQPIAGTLGERYLLARGVALNELPGDLSDVLRWHPACPWEGGTHACLVAVYTDIYTGEARAIHRTAISADGRRIARKSYGPIRGSVIRLWPDETVTHGLVIGEGIETVLVAATRFVHRRTLLQPAWAVGDAAHLATFPVLPGVEALSILVDHDHSGTGQRAARRCAQRWSAAGREVIRLTPRIAGNDFADVEIAQ